MRCSRPGVPGTAQGRASVSASRRYGQNSSPSGELGPVANAGSNFGRSAASGTRHGSEPLASEPSESSSTGVR
jgi:hypothetical protein